MADLIKTLEVCLGVVVVVAVLAFLRLLIGSIGQKWEDDDG